ncbi:unnamed protein product [marine sediment metagenome]|uniref:Uncharacterized protein n=1 Tax=marine sediment metagenome TaxID=412755 RepID=X1LET9_9ZZZZ
MVVVLKPSLSCLFPQSVIFLKTHARVLLIVKPWPVQFADGMGKPPVASRV